MRAQAKRRIVRTIVEMGICLSIYMVIVAYISMSHGPTNLWLFTGLWSGWFTGGNLPEPQWIQNIGNRNKAHD